MSVEELCSATVESLSHDGRGVARVDGKVVFISDALPGEEVRYRRGRKRRNYESGQLVSIVTPSPDRVEPKCPVFGICGGCSLQHLDHRAQLAAKHRQLVDNLERVGKVAADRYLPPLNAGLWNYRRRARLGVRFVPKKGGVLVGFRERHKSYVTPTDRCDVLHTRIATVLPSLTALIAGLSCPDRLPQIEVAVADNGAALVFRHLQALTDEDLRNLRDFGARQELQILLQPKGMDSIHRIWPDRAPTLYYRLEEFDLDIRFQPTDFVQINGPVNAALVRRAMELLAPAPTDTVLDLFCGIGNFSLPLARRAQRVLGIEGSEDLVQRARLNAQDNGLGNASFVCADLYGEDLAGSWLERRWDRMLLDPPRSGAMEVIKQVPALSPARIVYVSCNPATLARDAELLVREHGYHLRCAGIVDMFPHTAHVESIAQFDAPG